MRDGWSARFSSYLRCGLNRLKGLNARPTRGKPIPKMRLLRAFLLLLGCTLHGWAGITSFTATPLAFLPGEDVTLSWSVTAGDVISISPDVGPVSGATGSTRTDRR